MFVVVRLPPGFGCLFGNEFSFGKIYLVGGFLGWMGLDCGWGEGGECLVELHRLM